MPPEFSATAPVNPIGPFSPSDETAAPSAQGEPTGHVPPAPQGGILSSLYRLFCCVGDPEPPRVANTGLASSLQADRQECAQILASLPLAGAGVISDDHVEDGPPTLIAMGERKLMTQEEKVQLLIDAARQGSAEQMAVWIDAGVAPNATDVNGNTALMVAACKGHTECVKLLVGLLTADEIIQPDPYSGESALTLAAKSGHAEIVEVLASQLTVEQINHARPDGFTALAVAVRKGHAATVEVLASRLTGEQINHALPKGSTALILASIRGYTKIVEVLVRRLTPEQISCADERGNTALIAAAENGKTEIARMLADRLTPDQINWARPDGCTALHPAVSGNHHEIVQLLASRLPPEVVNQIDARGNRHLVAAVERGHVETVRVLLERLSDSKGAIDAYTRNFNALHLACRDDNVQIVKMLLAALAKNGRAVDPPPASKDRKTLGIAGLYGHFGVLLTWLAGGASDDWAEYFFETFDISHRIRKIEPDVLLRAAETGCGSLVSILLRRGANAEFTRGDGSSALDLAVRNGHLSVLQAWMVSGRPVPYQLIFDAAKAAGEIPQETELDQALEAKRTSALLRKCLDNGWVHLAEAVIENQVQVIGGHSDAPFEVDTGALQLAGRRGQFKQLFTALSRDAGEHITATFFNAFDAAGRRANSHPRALFDAAEAGYASVVLNLLERGADAGLQDENGRNALDLAINKGHLSVLDAWIAGGRRVSLEHITDAMQASGRYGGPMNFENFHPADAVDASNRTVLALAQSKEWTHLADTLATLKNEAGLPRKAQPGQPAVTQ